MTRGKEKEKPRRRVDSREPDGFPTFRPVLGLRFGAPALPPPPKHGGGNFNNGLDDGANAGARRVRRATIGFRAVAFGRAGWADASAPPRRVRREEENAAARRATECAICYAVGEGWTACGGESRGVRAAGGGLTRGGSYPGLLLLLILVPANAALAHRVGRAEGGAARRAQCPPSRPRERRASSSARPTRISSTPSLGGWISSFDHDDDGVVAPKRLIRRDFQRRAACARSRCFASTPAPSRARARPFPPPRASLARRALARHASLAADSGARGAPRRAPRR